MNSVPVRKPAKGPLWVSVPPDALSRGANREQFQHRCCENQPPELFSFKWLCQFYFLFHASILGQGRLRPQQQHTRIYKPCLAAISHATQIYKTCILISHYQCTLSSPLDTTGNNTKSNRVKFAGREKVQNPLVLHSLLGEAPVEMKKKLPQNSKYTF